jgi:hypothetical protein
MNEVNRMAAWVVRARATWKRQRSNLLPRMQAGETAIRVTLWKEMSTADIDLSKQVPTTETVETVLFRYSEDDGRWEVSADDWWAIIDDGCLP